MVHAWDQVRVDLAETVETLLPAAGWTQPRLAGWVGAARVLAGHQPRNWNDA